jgi:uncharacterized membrane protein HdeD (DUF308 family)
MTNSLTTPPPISYGLSRSVAARLSRYWWLVLLNGLALIVAGVLIFSIDWDRDSLSAFIGALFILEGAVGAMSDGVDRTTRRTNVIAGLASIAAGVAIIVWPSPGLVAVAVILGSWLIVTGTVAITAAFAARRVLPYWWTGLLVGLLEIPLGVLALADPGATLAAIITVGGIWAVSVGVVRVVLAFEIKRLPHQVDDTYGVGGHNGPATRESSTPVAAS